MYKFKFTSFGITMFSNDRHNTVYVHNQGFAETVISQTLLQYFCPVMKTLTMYFNLTKAKFISEPHFLSTGMKRVQWLRKPAGIRHGIEPGFHICICYLRQVYLVSLNLFALL